MTGEAFDPVEVGYGPQCGEQHGADSGGTEWSKRDKSTYDPTNNKKAYALNAGVVNIMVLCLMRKAGRCSVPSSRSGEAGYPSRL